MSRATEPRAAASGGFLRAVMVLASGAALAHGITALSMPVMSRLYSPEDFGLLAVFSGCLAILSVGACLRYELAIALPRDDAEASELLLLALACCLGMSLALALVVCAAPAWITEALGQPRLAPYLWLLPLGLFLSGSSAALQLWFVRNRSFAFLARTRIAQSAGSAGTQIALGLAGWHSLGLLMGYVLNTGIACLSMGKALAQALRRRRPGRLVALAKEYRRFPIYSTVEALANSAAIQLPVILIAAHVAPAEAGQLSMAMFVAQAPLSLIGNAISQVYLSRAPEELRAGRLGPFSVDVLGNLGRAGIGPLLAAGILSPALFPLVFGAEWERAGWLVSWMTPWFLLQFLAVPLSMALHVCSRQRMALVLQLGGLTLRVGAVLLCQHWQPDWTPEVYAVSGALFYLAYLLAIMRAVNADGGSAMRVLWRRSAPALAWALIASTAAAGIGALRS